MHNLMTGRVPCHGIRFPSFGLMTGPLRHRPTSPTRRLATDLGGARQMASEQSAFRKSQRAARPVAAVIRTFLSGPTTATAIHF